MNTAESTAAGTAPPTLPKLSALQWKILQNAIRGWDLHPPDAEPERVARSRAISRLVARGIVKRVPQQERSRYTSRVQVEIIADEAALERAALKAAGRDRDRGISRWDSPAGWFLYLMKDARMRRARERRRQEWREEYKRKEALLEQGKRAQLVLAWLESLQTESAGEEIAIPSPPSPGRIASQRGAVASYVTLLAKEGKEITPEAIVAYIGDLSGFDLETVTAHLEWMEDEGHLADIIAEAAVNNS